MTMIQVLDRAAQAASDDAETWRELQTDLSSLVADLAGVTLEHANRQFAPEQHALALLHVLHAQLAANQQPDQAWCSLAQTCLAHGQPQQLYICRAQVAVVADAFLRQAAATSIEQLDRALVIVKAVMPHVAPNPATFTGLHSAFLRACVVSKHYWLGLDLAEAVYHDVDPEGLSVQAMFEGLYAAVMILIAHKQFERAFRLTFQTTTLPAEAPSAIAVAAWKKHILLSALLNRKAMSLSEQSSLSGIVSRNISRLCVPYEDFAKALGKSTSPADVAALVTRHTETFTRDGNLGLVKQCVAAGDRHRVHKLTKVYVKLSFEDVKVKAGLASEAQAEAILADMIAKGTIRARIDQPNRTVAFADVTVSAHEEQAAAETIQHLVQRVQGLLQLLDTKDRAVQLSKPYIEAQIKSEQMKSGLGDMAGLMDEST